MKPTPTCRRSSPPTLGARYLWARSEGAALRRPRRAPQALRELRPPLAGLRQPRKQLLLRLDNDRLRRADVCSSAVLTYHSLRTQPLFAPFFFFFDAAFSFAAGRWPSASAPSSSLIVASALLRWLAAPRALAISSCWRCPRPSAPDPAPSARTRRGARCPLGIWRSILWYPSPSPQGTRWRMPSSICTRSLSARFGSLRYRKGAARCSPARGARRRLEADELQKATPMLRGVRLQHHRRVERHVSHLVVDARRSRRLISSSPPSPCISARVLRAVPPRWYASR